MTERSWFDEVAEIYDRVRPLYPTRLFDDLLTYLGRDPERLAPLAVVEIGPGTGQATAPLLARGMTVTAVEPGPRLAAYLRRKLADEPRLTVLNDRFEDAPLPVPRPTSCSRRARSTGSIRPCATGSRSRSCDRAACWR